MACYSYSPGAQQCDKAAGHKGIHSRTIKVEWDDATAWTPTSLAGNHPAAITAADLGPAPIPVSYDEDMPIGATLVDECFSCGHTEHSGPCEVTSRSTGGDPCGCQFVSRAA